MYAPRTVAVSVISATYWQSSCKPSRLNGGASFPSTAGPTWLENCAQHVLTGRRGEIAIRECSSLLQKSLSGGDVGFERELVTEAFEALYVVAVQVQDGRKSPLLAS
jgi:hypothetical protein